jgi:hypothetical protein
MLAGSSGTRLWLIAISLFAAGVMLEAVCQQMIMSWIRRTRGRNWPAVSAVIDLVSVAVLEDDSILPPIKASSGSAGYLATLTYIYRNPEEQVGEYRRSFGNKGDAEAWANSYKGETVRVHVDPRDPARSILREEDL